MGYLADLMEFDHVVSIVDGLAFSAGGDLHAPELYDGALGIHDVMAWEFVGTSGQQGGGPILHNSETLDGPLEDAIRGTDGLYVAVVCTWLPEHEDGDPITEGWAVLRYVGD